MTESEAIEELKYDCNELGKAIPCETSWGKFLMGAFWCPNCKHVAKSGSFCKDCGQKLDWEIHK